MRLLLFLGGICSTITVSAAVLTVTTTDNINPSSGQLSFKQALGQVQAGDTIAFNIPGAGPHLILTPPGGYPYVTADNVTIDGYTQPGSSPNSNPILAANNAKIQIVLDSRNGNYTLMDYAGTTPNDDTGFGDGEAAIIGVIEAKNFTIRGTSLVGVPLVGPTREIGMYGLALAKGASARVSGNWLGVAPDGTTVAPTANGISGFRYRGRDEANVVTNTILIKDILIGVGKNSSNAPADFNIFVGHPAIPVIIEGENIRISGNFFMVLPDGKTDFNVTRKIEGSEFEGAIEIGRAGNNTLIGVDGDGINDSNERNIFGGTIPESLGGYDHTIEFYGQTPGTNIIVAGNYIGVGVDGTRFENAASPLNAAGDNASYRFGSDFDGVSDAFEGNVVYNYFPSTTIPASTLGEDPAKLNFFDELKATALVSVRGNTFVNNLPMPASLLNGAGEFLPNYYGKALADSTAGFTPALVSNSTTTKLVGTVPLPGTEYPGVAIDVYVADPEGIATGIATGVPEYAEGFVQGKTYLGSFTVDGPADLNAGAGVFEFEASNLNLTAGSKITITANYFRDPIGSHNATTITSPFSAVAVLSQGTGGGPIQFTAVVKGNSNLVLNWTGGNGPFTVEKTTSLTSPSWTTVGTPGERTLTVPIDAEAGFYRVR